MKVLTWGMVEADVFGGAFLGGEDFEKHELSSVDTPCRSGVLDRIFSCDSAGKHAAGVDWRQGFMGRQEMLQGPVRLQGEGGAGDRPMVLHRAGETAGLPGDQVGAGAPS